MKSSWEQIRLGEIADIVYGKGLPTKNLLGDGYPVFGASNVIGYFSEYIYEDRQLLISCRGAKSGTINVSPEKCFVTNNSLIVDFPVEKEVLRRTYYYFLQAANKHGMVTGTAQPQVTINNAIEVELPLPPLNEQLRIVAKIEELFSELEKGVESLKAAKAQLAVYRQSVLKAAFEGRLTEEWRKEHAAELESASELLSRIKAEREARYAAQLAEWQASDGMIDGKKVSKPKKPKELPPLTAAELAALPELPEGWGWARIGSLSPRVTVGHVGPMKNEYVPEGIAFLRSQNVRENRFSAEGLMRISPAFHMELGKSQLLAGDIVIVRSGSVGTTCVIPNTLIEANCADLVVVKKSQYVLSELISFYVNSVTKTRVHAQKVGVALIHFNTTSVERFPIPICSTEEQRQIVQEIEARFSVVEKMEQTIEESLQKAEALRQSILKRAFEGKLVSQDPTDEPASAFLARIRAERVPSPKQRRQSAASVKHA